MGKPAEPRGGDYGRIKRPIFSLTMVNLTYEEKIIFFKTMHGDIAITEFEKWIYDNKDLEKKIPADQYLNLIELNYKKPGVKYELFKLFESVISFGEYQKWKLNTILDQALLKDESFPRLMMEFYDLYCDGYYFLRDLGLGYGLMFTTPPSKYKVYTWEELSPEQKSQQISRLFPKIEKELLKVKGWIDKGKIVLTGNKDELNNYDYEDFRTEEERKSDVWVPVNKAKK